MFVHSTQRGSTQIIDIGRKVDLRTELQHFQSNNIPQNEFQDYLRSKCGSNYDNDVFSQLMELACDQNNMININTFIDEFIDTENTLTYRMESLGNRIHDLKMEKDCLKQKIQSEKIQALNKPGQSRLIVQVIGATNIELAKNYTDVKAYVKVQCGREVYNSKMIIDRNPIWSESFDFQINESQDSNHILSIEVYDQNRGLNQEYYGKISFSMNELRKSNQKDINENLLRKDSIKIKAKIQVKIKYIQSKVTIYQNDEQNLIEELKKLEGEYQDNENALEALNGPFGNYTAHHRQFKESPMNYLDDQETNEQSLSVHPYESQLTDFVHNLQLVPDWNRLYLQVAVVFITLCLITSLYRVMLLDLTLGGILVLLIFQNELTQRRLRIMTLIYALQLLLELIWLAIFHYNWVNDPNSTNGEKSMKHFIIIMSYIVLSVRIPFTILTWKNSVYFQDIEIMMEKYSNLT